MRSLTALCMLLFAGTAWGFENPSVRNCALEYRDSQKRFSELSAGIVGSSAIGYEYQEWFRQQSFRYVTAGYEVLRQMTYDGDEKACAELSAQLLKNAEKIVVVTRYIASKRVPPFELSFDDANHQLERSRSKAE